jgi:hypothetical protein
MFIVVSWSSWSIFMIFINNVFHDDRKGFNIHRMSIIILFVYMNLDLINVSLLLMKTLGIKG